MTFFTPPLLLLLVGSMLLSAPTLPSAPDLVPSDANAARTIVDFLREEIRSDDLTRREYALMDVIPLVNCRTFCTVHLLSAGKTVHVQNDPVIGSMLDLSGLAPDLAWAYQTGPSDNLRLLALSGLLHLGNEPILESLISLSAEMSARVRQTTHRGLAAVLLERYPALDEQVARTRTLSLIDIERARTQQQKASSSSRRSSGPGN